MPYASSSRLSPGRRLSHRELVTITGQRIAVPAPGRFVHLQFRRFAGCPVCNLHLRQFARRAEEVRSESILEVVVFHSTTEALLPFVSDFPFAVVADPDKRLYRQFGVESGVRAMLDPRSWPAILRGVLRSLGELVRGEKPMPPINPAGGRWGLPADFLIDAHGTVLDCHYGAHADDQWSVDELLRLVRWESSSRPEELPEAANQ